MKKLFFVYLLILGSITVKSQVSLRGQCIEFDESLPYNANIHLTGENGKIYNKSTNNGFFEFDSISKGVYKMIIEPSPKFKRSDTIADYCMPSDSFTFDESKFYCTIIKENFLVDTSIYLNIYFLFTCGSNLVGDGFPCTPRLFKILPIPFLISSSTSSHVSGGSVEKYSKIIGTKETKDISLRGIRIWTHTSYGSFHDIYIKPQNADTIHYNCFGGLLYLLEN